GGLGPRGGAVVQPRPPAAAPAPQPAAAIIRPAPGGDAVLPRRGSVCGNPAIQGASVAPITGRIRGCGIARPVQVTAVGGVALSTPALMDCPTALALLSWVENGAKRAVGRTGGGLARLEIAAHYVCRTRNHRSGAPLSEHARGKAIDIRAFVLANGQRIEVLRSFRGPHRDMMRSAYRAACGPFGTTLGPGSDGYHEDHFHFDTASHRSGPYCR
ncbi:MAG: extensin family protein, partial [Gemmobacter sp.]